MTTESPSAWRDLWRLSWPVALSMLATMSMGLVDLMMLGRIGAEALASLSLAITWWVAVGVFSRNICRGLEPFVSQAFGAERHGEVRNWLLQGLYTTYLWIPPYFVLMIFASTGLRLLGQPEELMANVELYCRVLALAIPFEVTFFTIRQWLQNQHHVRQALVAIVIANVLNIVFNYLLIFTFDFGIVGCALATLLCQGLQLAILVGLCWRSHLQAIWQGSLRPVWSQITLMTRYSVPAAALLSIEAWGFVAASIMVGWLGATALAAHSIGLNIVSTSFMVVLGLSTAAATLVGNAVGAQRAWMPLVWRALGLMGGIQIPMAILLWCFVLCVDLHHGPSRHRALDHCAPDRCPLSFMRWGAGHALCGDPCHRRCQMALLGGLIAHWCIGLPLAYWLGEVQGGGIAGVWYGLLGALICASVFVSFQILVAESRSPLRSSASC